MKDRITLGAISGATATVAKSIVIEGFKKLGLAEFNGAETAAGMLLPAYKINTPDGKLVGHITNMMVGTALGVGITYVLSATGKDKATFKGTAIAGLFWTLFYGNYANMGGSTVRPALPSTILSNFVGHLVYGTVSSSMITLLGDPSLFNGEIPLINTKRNREIKVYPHHTQKKSNSSQKIIEDSQPYPLH